MKKIGSVIPAIILLVFISVQSCKKEKNGSGETKTSTAGSRNSHNTGQNCMNCHKSGGSGEGVFTAAGSVYDSLQTGPYPNATIKFYTQPNGGGQVRATLSADALGNLYTTSTIDFSGGLYPAVSGTTGYTNYMSMAISSGACNSCHGSSAGKIWIK